MKQNKIVVCVWICQDCVCVNMSGLCVCEYVRIVCVWIRVRIVCVCVNMCKDCMCVWICVRIVCVCVWIYVQRERGFKELAHVVVEISWVQTPQSRLKTEGRAGVAVWVLGYFAVSPPYFMGGQSSFLFRPATDWRVTFSPSPSPLPLWRVIYFTQSLLN